MVQSNRDLLDNISCAPQQYRRYGSIIKTGAFCTNISWYLYHYAYAGHTQVIWTKEKKRQRRKKRGSTFRFKITSCVEPKQAFIALICCGQYVWLLVRRDMAI